MSGHPLSNQQRRNMKRYLTKQKPQNWRELIQVLNDGQPWVAHVNYYQFVQSGVITDNVFRERWVVGNRMIEVPSAATKSEKGFIDFLKDIKVKQIRQNQSSTPSPPTAPQQVATAKTSPPENKNKSSTPANTHHELPPKQPIELTSKSKSIKNSYLAKKQPKEKKRTISLMIEPSLYDQVKAIAELQDRSVGAQIRHAIKRNLEENLELLDK